MLDVAKYIITAILLATWFSDIGQWEWYSYLLPVIAVVASAVTGLSVFSNEDINKKRNKRRTS